MESPADANGGLSKEILSLLHKGNSACGPVYCVATKGAYTQGHSLLNTDSNLLAKVAQAEAPDTTLPLEQVNAAASKEIYFPLLPATVRTILLHPGGPKDPIVCSLVQPTVIKDQVQALSYVWGSHENPACILLNGRLFYITRNLEAALLRLRGEECFRELWIDALSINQFDQAERNEQVRRMHQVYAQVTGVLAWLGPTNEIADLATFYISLAEDLKEYENISGNWIDIFNEGFNELTSDELQDIAYSLLYLYRNEYWDRVWIVQEIALAKRVIVVCGECKPVTLPAFIGLGAALDSRKLKTISSFSNESYNFSLMLSSLAIIGPNTCSLTPRPDLPWTNTTANNLLHIVRTKHCKDPRDKIFGCYNLLEPALKGKIPVDYSRDAREVIISSLKTVIEMTQRLDFITWGKARNNRPKVIKFESTFPFWAPTLYLNMEDVKCELAGNFDAGRDSPGTISFLSGSDILRTKGVRLGYVHDTFIPLPAYDTNAPGPLWEADDRRHPLSVLDFTRSCIERVEKDYGGPMDRTKLIQTVTQGQNDSPQALSLLIGLTTLPANDTNEHIASLSPEMLSLLEASSRLLSPRAFFLMIPADLEKEECLKPDMGLGTHDLEPGDIVCVLLGCKVPVVLRPEGEHYRVICDAYVHGCMYGEGLNAVEHGKEELEEFLLC